MMRSQKEKKNVSITDISVYRLKRGDTSPSARPAGISDWLDCFSTEYCGVAATLSDCLGSNEQ